MAKELRQQINMNMLLTSAEKLAFLKRIVDKEAQSIVSQVKSNSRNYATVECVI